MNLKDYILKSNKIDIYNFYLKINSSAVAYEKITRNDIYHNIISSYKNDPEIILQLCSMEEISILKKLLDDKIRVEENGYIDYVLFKNLSNNFLILNDGENYYLPEDLVNCVKMAINLLDEKLYTARDIVDSTIIGVARVYNTLLIDDAINLLKKYSVTYDKLAFKKYIKSNVKLKDRVAIVRFKKNEYFISLEYSFYKEVLDLRKNIDFAIYSLEEMISFGKYKINLFQEKVLFFLNFLEMHMKAYGINSLIDDLIFYFGIYVNDEKILNSICGNILELQKEIVLVEKYFPIWIYNGNNLEKLKNDISWGDLWIGLV